MANQYVFAVGKMIADGPATKMTPAASTDLRQAAAEMKIDTRLAELLDWRREEQRELPLPADLIIWLEDRGFTVDLLTGCTSRLEPLQNMIDEAAVPSGLPEPPTRGQRVDEAAFLADTARYYEWLKAEREDYEDYLEEIEWLRLGC